jgi:hypothetical protein
VEEDTKEEEEMDKEGGDNTERLEELEEGTRMEGKEEAETESMEWVIRAKEEEEEETVKEEDEDDDEEKEEEERVEEEEGVSSAPKKEKPTS